MNANSMRLSVEELALTLGQIGSPDIAQSVIVAQLGEISQEEVQARLIAAGHSLMARRLMTLDAAGAIILSDKVVRIARVLTQADFSVRYSMATPDADLQLSYHFGEGAIFRHLVELGVVHDIVEFTDPAEIVRGGLEFFELAGAHPFDCPPAEITNMLLDELKNQADSAVIERRLAQTGAPPETRKLLAEDLQRTAYRGSALRVEYGADRVPVAERGLLVLRGPQRLWLLRPFRRQNQPFVTLLPGTETNFRRELSALLAPGA